MRERGLKKGLQLHYDLSYTVAPVRERGLKTSIIYMPFLQQYVAPVRERGLKKGGKLDSRRK